MRISLPDVLSANAGYVDTAGFLALNGLFTSHVTGNFVTLGSSLVLGTSGALAKVLALPVFCLTVFLSRLLGQRHKGAGHSALSTLLTLQFTLLVAGAALAIWLGPFASGGSTSGHCHRHDAGGGHGNTERCAPAASSRHAAAH